VEMVFHFHGETGYRCRQFIRNLSGKSPSSFGTRIATDGTADGKTDRFNTDGYDSRHTGSGGSEGPVVLVHLIFSMAFSAHWRAFDGGLLARAGQTGARLVADTRLFPRFSGAHLCGLPGVGEEKDSTRYENRS
jgi:hypothetical protein